MGFDPMMRGDGDVVSGWKNKLQSAIASVTPSDMLASSIARWPSQAPEKKAKAHGLGAVIERAGGSFKSRARCAR